MIWAVLHVHPYIDVESTYYGIGTVSIAWTVQDSQELCLNMIITKVAKLDVQISKQY